MSANSLVEGNDRCPHAPARSYHKTSGNWFYRVLFYPRKGGKGTRKDIYAHNLPGDLDPWKTEDEMKQYQVAIWNAFKHNEDIVLDDRPNKKRRRLKDTIAVHRKLSGSETQELKRMVKLNKKLEMNKKREELRADLLSGLDGNEDGLPQLKSIRFTKYHGL